MRVARIGTLNRSVGDTFARVPARAACVILLYERIVLLLPLGEIHNDGDNISEANVLQLFSRQRRPAPRFALYEDLAACIHLRRETQLLPDAEF